MSHDLSPAYEDGRCAEACQSCGGSLPDMPPSQKRRFCGMKCAGRAKLKPYVPLTCVVCLKDWLPKTREQRARNVTCSRECAGKLISDAKAGKTKPMDERPGMMTVECATCGTGFFKPKAWIKRTNASYCSPTCLSLWQGTPERMRALRSVKPKMSPERKARLSITMTGPSNPSWKGGVTYRRRHGSYVNIPYVRCPPELRGMARADGYVMQHRLVMARWVGRCLTRTECVHHKDHNPLNNNRSNLELWPDNRSHKMAEHGICAIGAANDYIPAYIVRTA